MRPPLELSLTDYLYNLGPLFETAEAARRDGQDVIIWRDKQWGFILASYHHRLMGYENRPWSDCHTRDPQYYLCVQDALRRWCGIYLSEFDAEGVFI